MSENYRIILVLEEEMEKLRRTFFNKFENLKIMIKLQRPFCTMNFLQKYKFSLKKTG